ncbi:Argininosuccinate lyase (plasmid) [Variovorax sp. SRS16]|uniref:Bug family tripartite tricarboxylate transporter substrate binding protein n=1 Tax=Variovorax sp. SRS16 TaxID=282217 RepID=UPI0013163B27|nr:tripartite tricarboxylate transporter substrate binding protein [Variovorax sp. SRS16]VTU45717.1 Argininosuccinate lyase [Variovorax sp. SRS16]
MASNFLACALVLLSGIVCASAAGAAGAEDAPYPSRSIKIVVPFPPGGATDAIARVVGAELSKRIKQPVIMDNRAGAGGNIGAELVAKSPADGYTLLLGTISTNAINESLYRNLSFSAQRELKPIAPLAGLPLVLVTSRPNIRSVEDLIRIARQSPGQVTYASPGSGTAPHLAAEIFQRMSQTTLTHVPYKGSGPMITDVIAGRVDVAFDTVISSLSHIKSGRLKALGVTTAESLPDLSTVPPIAKAGVPGFEITAWNGLFAPIGTPSTVVETLNREVSAVLADPKMKQRIMDIGGVPMLQDTSGFATFVKSEHDKYRDTIQRANISIE